MKMHGLLFILILPVIIVSCQTAVSRQSADLSETHTPIPVNYQFEVTFDGHQCSVTGPSETTVGSKVFLFTNNSGKRAILYVCRLETEKSYNDVLEYIGEPGSDVPEVVWCKKIVGTYEFPGEKSSLWKFYFQEGEYSILCEQTEYPAGIWPGSRFFVRSIALADIVGSWSQRGSKRLLIFNDDGSYEFVGYASVAETHTECYGQIELNSNMLTFLPADDAPSGCAGDVIVYNIELNEEGQLVFSVVEDECGIVHLMTNRSWNRNSP